MCEICKNTVNRDYTHSKNKHHYRLLLEIMQYKKNDKFKCYYRSVRSARNVRCTNGYANGSSSSLSLCEQSVISFV